MKNSILMVGFDRDKFGDIKQECPKSGVSIHTLGNTSQALLEVLKRNHYLLIVIFSDDDSYLRDLTIIRG